MNTRFSLVHPSSFRLHPSAFILLSSGFVDFVDNRSGCVGTSLQLAHCGRVHSFAWLTTLRLVSPVPVSRIRAEAPGTVDGRWPVQ
jgi:hypothetical protein